MPYMSGRACLLALLKQEGITHMFGNPGTTELALMDQMAGERDIHYVLGLAEVAVMAMTDGYAQAHGLAFCNLHVAPGLGNAMGMLYDAMKSGSPIIVTAGQHPTDFAMKEPLLWAELARDRAAVRQMVGGSEKPRRPAADDPPRRENRAGAADGAGLPVAARRRADRRGRGRSRPPIPRRQRHPRRRESDRRKPAP